MIYFTLTALFSLVAVFFAAVRIPELSTVLCTDLTGAFVILLAFGGCASTILYPAKTWWLKLRRFALVALALAYVKQRLDSDIQLNLSSKDLTDHIAIVTGGNSGTGLAVAKLLVSLGSTVILACRNEERCEIAVKRIGDLYPMKRPLVVAMKLDLDDLASVKGFSKQFMKRYKRLDILVNNAGLIAEPGSLTAQGLEQSFGAMHIGHFALTKYLLKLLLKPVPGGRGVHDSARVVNIASDGMFAGNFHPSLMTGTGGGDLKAEITDNCGFVNGIECCPFLACPNTNGYARAKLAGALHAYELQRRVDDHIAQQSGAAGGSKSYRRLVTASLHPGSVSTGIHGFLSSQLTAMFLRSSDQAGHVLLHAILDDSFIPSSYIDAMRVSHDLFNYRDLHLQRHYSAFPQARSLPFASAPDHQHRVTLHSVLWSRQKMIYAQPHTASAEANSTVTGAAELEEVEYYRKDSVAARLWDVSEQIVSDWEAKKPLFATNVSTTSGSKLKL